MSQQTVNQAPPADGPGYYGKIPSRGDFISRRLPRAFTDPWETWLQEALASSQERLGAQWLDNYLTSPLWRFALSPGICGDQAWTGLIMPSVDRVGRYYPLTFAARLAPSQDLFRLMEQAEPWFAGLEQLALSCLEDGFEIDRFEAELQALGQPGSPATAPNAEPDPGSHSQGSNAWHMNLVSQASISSAYPRFLPRLLHRLLFAYSLWWTPQGSERVVPSLLLCQGLPQIQGSSALIDGLWSEHGWEEVDAFDLSMTESSPG